MWVLENNSRTILEYSKKTYYRMLRKKAGISHMTHRLDYQLLFWERAAEIEPIWPILGFNPLPGKMDCQLLSNVENREEEKRQGLWFCQVTLTNPHVLFPLQVLTPLSYAEAQFFLPGEENLLNDMNSNVGIHSTLCLYSPCTADFCKRESSDCSQPDKVF